MNLKDRIILEDYRKKKDLYIELGNIVHERLTSIVKNANIQIMAIEHRVKTEKSLEGKLAHNGDYYQKLDDLIDILGARIICFFSDEVDKIGSLIEKNFVVDWSRSSDKRKLIDVSSFGYLSLHYICSVKKEEGFSDEMCNIRFEIQIRTNLQHTWAQINHDLGYKNEFGVPRFILRNFSRIAGMLELIDDEFVRARDLMKSYTASVKQKIIDNCADDVHIDTLSLSEFVKNNKVMKAFCDKLSKTNKVEIDYVDPSSYIEQLKWFGIETLGGLQDLMAQNSDLALDIANRSLATSDLDIISSNTCLRSLCRAKLINDNYSEEQIVQFLMISLGDEERARKQAKFLIRSMK